MWRSDSLFGQSPTPSHHAAVHADTHQPLSERIRILGDHMGQTVWSKPIPLCHVCHAELQLHESSSGCCDDKDACCWRALSGRCCW